MKRMDITGPGHWNLLWVTAAIVRAAGAPFPTSSVPERLAKAPPSSRGAVGKQRAQEGERSMSSSKPTTFDKQPLRVRSARVRN